MLHLAAHAGRDGDAELRELVQEVSGAIERVDDPGDVIESLTSIDLRAFLAQKAVRGVALADGIDDQRFGFAVNLGDEIIALFLLNFEFVDAIKVAHDVVASEASGGNAGIE